MADKRISQLIERVDIANNDVLPIVASGATTTNKVTISTLQTWMQGNLDVGVTSVGLVMPSAFSVSGSPVTTSGNITVSAAGTASQYIRGDGTLADFPTGGGGGSSVSYYLNGSVSQGTIGGIAYRELNKTPILGVGTDFTIAADGYIASFVTDAGDPGLLEIPAGNWNFETYFQASSGGGTPSFYIELYKISGTTATLIASNSATPELIAFGTTINPYFSALAVPQTSLLVTDRLAIRYYVAHSGRTITLHTENNTLCQIITTFTTGLTALNGLTAQVQNFAVGTSGTDFNISSAGSIHTFNLPDASASNRGAVTTGTQTFAGYKIFNGTIGVNQDIQLATQGTALNTFIKNINATGQTSIGSNGFGFNNANNIYFSGSSKGGGIFAFNNTGNQTYTLPDASGTIALTSDLGNYIQGVGTADSIPKFTGARTIANSAIRDTTSTVVISKNVSVDNGASQAINLSPASGGTTNRIETTGTLPLAIITSGSSITLAAGGVTPQITLASSGAVTLTGALNGTSGTFTTDLTLTNSSFSLLKFVNTTASKTWNMYAYEDGSFNLGVSGVGNFLGISSTGAATFSSSVTIEGNNSTIRSGNELRFNRPDNAIYTRMYDAGSLAANGFTFQNMNGEGFHFKNTSSTIMRLDSANNVGIGTASPVGKLHIAATSAVASPGSIALSIRDASNPIFGFDFNLEGVSTGDMSLMRTVSGVQSQVMTFARANGNVGIGTASPARKLDVNGVTRSTAFDVYYNSVLSGFILSENQWAGGSSTNLSLAAETGNAITFFTNGSATERMRITSGGSVQIGTSSGSGARTFIYDNRSNSTALDEAALYIRQDGSNAIQTWASGGAIERMRITSGGDVFVGKQTTGASERFVIAKSSAASLALDRLSDDGGIMRFYQDGTEEGNITISGTTVSYNGGHLSRYSQTPTNSRIDGLVKGTIMSNLDEMAVWINPETGEPYPNEQLNCMKISDVEGDKNVAGVFVDWDNDDEVYTNDMNIAMTGDMIIRIAEGVIVEKGDLLISAGDGTAKPQSDDLIRSNTIAKVTSNHVTCVYEDGSYCVPCVLMAC